ncbi:flavin reductase (DIM6/NTAB) family NADH-FMN oxidoreductase RutF [Pacificibacter maritimus]|uniref:Flavin reductase (DIM6/NTAB) family NADH-FMN oxidoreductase RutF n=1 Tax=Pacificibacter maritimus TaxID=762213 RepID=A0A3N4V0N3_9RHOB|nr:flavin reductase family protein [Pacificibacter maritimus]RPE67400.1 flavin reductase (DIM6/NTAB) family NADH-FMN oxidoreductase RutF [Pacificibacter maritimus]
MPECFEPNADNTRLLRDAFGRFATGVTVITTASSDGPVGITANSFSSLSLDPALVLWSPAKGTRRFKYFEAAPDFAIHILAADQAEICEGFARNMHAFDNLDMTINAQGVPLINNCLTRLECRHVATHPGGDHVIVVGQVTRAEINQGTPLGFFAGQFGVFQAA